MSWEGRTALVTGAAAGIGLATAKMIAERGGRVLLADRDEAGLADAAAAVGDACITFTLDVSDLDACRAMVARAVDAFGRLDAAVNNAGVNTGRGVKLVDVDVDSYHRMLRVNLDGTFFCMRAEIAAMLETGGGSIVNIGSVLSTVGRAGSAPYAATKHAILGLTRTAALEYGEYGVRVNCVGPGFVPTGLSGGAPADVADAMVRQFHATGKAGTPEGVAELVCFLASDASAMCTGGWYAADAGWTAS